MPEAEVLYADLFFIKSRGNQSADGKPARSKLTTERAALAVVCVLLLLALIALCYVSYQNIQSGKNLQRLKAEREELEASQSESSIFQDGVCKSCDTGWELNGESCYRFSTDKFTWEQSQNKCRLEDAQLVKIDSRDEQIFVERKLRDKMSSLEDKFWIGLTDSEREGRWLWTDGSALDPSLSFWSGKEPDNWPQGDEVGEDCARMGEKNGAADLRCWFDQACRNPHKRVCEKTARKGRSFCRFL
ncbi:immune-related, lectin-like receptor 4 isoform X2 [Syngnathoides biaculeatus]|uniref:immune-related, lectin-like receptor 4 isoform X2 n=1 Tax=Syngnathoides biaculeatus TaxID=300417 RepID=UPI002ADE00FB|nr:immune-related, lectin-like receptor 4 isoform X2 [Syngnathoides biaculeatus]